MTLKVNTASVKRLDKKIKQREKKFAPVLEGKYDKLGKEAKKQVKSLESRYRKEIRLSKRGAVKNLPAELGRTLDGYFKQIEKEAKDSVKKELFKHAKDKKQKLDVANIQAKKAIKGNRQWSKDLAKKQVRDYEKYINDAIKRAKEVNPNITQAEIKTLIDDKTQAFKNVRVNTTTKNEANRIQNQVRLNAYRESGLVRGIIFTAILDDVTTDNCRDKDGTRIAIDDPRIQFFMIPQHINCRSYHVYILMTNSRTKLTNEAQVNELVDRFKKIIDVNKPEGQPQYYSYEESEDYIYFELLTEVAA